MEAFSRSWLLLQFTPSNDDVQEWRPVEELPMFARAKVSWFLFERGLLLCIQTSCFQVAAIKFMSRWVVGQKSNEHDIGTKAITLLIAVLYTKGDVKKSGKFRYVSCWFCGIGVWIEVFIDERETLILPLHREGRTIKSRWLVAVEGLASVQICWHSLLLEKGFHT